MRAIILGLAAVAFTATAGLAQTNTNPPRPALPVPAPAPTPAPAPAASGLLDGTDPQAVLAIARGYGQAELGVDSVGDPKISATMGGQSYTVFFYGCTNGAQCTSIQFWTYYVKGPKATLEAVNEWNLGKRFSKVYIDGDGDVAVEFDVNLFGGVSSTNLDDTFDWWRVLVDATSEEFAS